MTCASCVARVEKAIARVPDVQQASINLATSTAQVKRLAGSAADAELLAAVKRAGYEAATIDSGGAAPKPARGDQVWRVAAAAALSAPLVLPMIGDLLGRHWPLPMSAWR